jgi:phospholipase/lecithinase/hemolysin
MSLIAKVTGAAIAAALLTSSLASHASAPRYDAVYVFGDSYCDVGNIYFATGGLEPAAPYYAGRFSNGPIWVDHVAGSYGLTLRPSLLGGTDYAFGGAEVTAAVPEGNVSIPSVPQQIELYLSTHHGKADPKALYVVEGGGNDILNSNGAGSPTTLADEIAVGLGGGLQLLYEAGARNFVVPNLLDVGLLPAAQEENIASFATAATLRLNFDLAYLPHLLPYAPGAKLYLLDVYSLVESMQIDPTHYGFSNITAPCFVAAPLPSLCSNPYAYLFWDDAHPTFFMHSFFAVQAQQALNQ